MTKEKVQYPQNKDATSLDMKDDVSESLGTKVVAPKSNLTRY